MPKKYFDNVYKNLTSGKAITAHEQQPNIKHQCDRNIATQLNCAQNVVDGICSDSVTKLICEMRACLLRRDWHNLARLISLYAEMPLGKERWYPIVLRVSGDIKMFYLFHFVYLLSFQYFPFSVFSHFSLTRSSGSEYGSLG